MTKAETRMTNQTRMAKPEAMRGAWSFELGHSLVIGAWFLVIPFTALVIHRVVRHSGLALRNSRIRVHLCSSVVSSFSSACEERFGRVLSIRVHPRASAVSFRGC
jgi:hypothetical protein